MKKFFAIACIIVLTLGLLLVSCQKKEEHAAPAVEKAVEAPAQTEQKPAAAGYDEKKPAATGYGEEKKAETEEHK